MICINNFHNLLQITYTKKKTSPLKIKFEITTFRYLSEGQKLAE
jgi:hypothetical protein